MNAMPQTQSLLTPQILPSKALHFATSALHSIITDCFEHDDTMTSLVVYDQACELANCLTQAYQNNLTKNSHFILFSPDQSQEILTQINRLPPGSLVVLIQSTHFRLEAYRLRVELFKRQLKVIEHPHLARMQGEEAWHYLRSLEYDRQYYRTTGRRLKQFIDVSESARVITGKDKQLYFSGPLEEAKLNVGDYSQMTNWGGQFPIGEVFTESKDLTQVNGDLEIFAFGDMSYLTNFPQQTICLHIEGGQVVDTSNATDDFLVMLDKIRADDGVIWLREFGLGLNRAFSKEIPVRDVGTFERMCGVHFSLGSKHGSYAKPFIKRGEGRHHVDVFADAKLVFFDQTNVFDGSKWVFP